MKLFDEHIEKFVKLFRSISDEYKTPGQGYRVFAATAFKASKLDWRYYRDELFNRKESNATYVKMYESTDMESRKPILYIQKDIDATYSLHKSFVARHKTRLQHYRDDFANKDSRLITSITYTQGLVNGINSLIKGEQ